MNHTDSGEGSSSSSRVGHEKDISLDALGGRRDVEANSVGSGATTASNDTQAGVKIIEAVSMTWTKWGLIAAYVRFVEKVTGLWSHD